MHGKSTPYTGASFPARNLPALAKEKKRERDRESEREREGEREIERERKLKNLKKKKNFFFLSVSLR
jgi:hypothetical protein